MSIDTPEDRFWNKRSKISASATPYSMHSAHNTHCSSKLALAACLLDCLKPTVGFDTRAARVVKFPILFVLSPPPWNKTKKWVSQTNGQFGDWATTKFFCPPSKDTSVRFFPECTTTNHAIMGDWVLAASAQKGRGPLFQVWLCFSSDHTIRIRTCSRGFTHSLLVTPWKCTTAATANWFRRPRRTEDLLQRWTSIQK